MARESGYPARRGGHSRGGDRRRRERPWGDNDRGNGGRRNGRGFRGGNRGRGNRRFRRDDEVEENKWGHDQYQKLDPKDRLDKRLDSYWMKDEGSRI